MNKTDELFEKVEFAAVLARLAAWDGCHKIYFAMDDIEAAWFRENYEYIQTGSPEALAGVIRNWYDRSCGLRFVSAVYHNEEDPNAGFVNVIAQFEDDPEDDA